MQTQISTKLTAFVIAVAINGAILAGIAYVMSRHLGTINY
jgi:hypothetical protein